MIEMRVAMYRFFVSPDAVSDKEIRITGDDVNHMKNVLRMGTGEPVVVSCGRGIDYYCVIREVGEQTVFLDVREEQPAVTELPVRITLFQALPKKDKMELVIQKAIELGAAEIVPVRTRRCIVKLDEKKEDKKLQRWKTIAESAAKQSGRALVPDIHPVLSWEGALAYAENMETKLIPYELCGDMAGSVSAMKKAAEGESIGIFIGPEGGFERGEVEQAIEAGAVPVSLGKRILRTETAGLAVLSVLMFWIEASGKE